MRQEFICAIKKYNWCVKRVPQEALTYYATVWRWQSSGPVISFFMVIIGDNMSPVTEYFSQRTVNTTATSESREFHLSVWMPAPANKDRRLTDVGRASVDDRRLGWPARVQGCEGWTLPYHVLATCQHTHTHGTVNMHTHSVRCAMPVCRQKIL